MELIGIVLVLLVILGHFVEGFAVFNLIQFFRGKETANSDNKCTTHG